MKKASEMKAAGQGGSSLVVTGRCPVTAEDFCSLQNGMWLTDSIIEAFAKSLLRKSVNASDNRILFLSSQAIATFTSTDAAVRSSLSRWLNGIELHEFDVLLWPINYRKHWLLCVAYSHQRKFILLDPYNPQGLKKRSRYRSEIVLKINAALDTLSENYMEKYKDERKWTYATANNDASKLNLPKQPSSNGSDCGVLVCMYILSYLSSMPWPSLEQCENFSAVMEYQRSNIGGHIISGGVVVDTESAGE